MGYFSNGTSGLIYEDQYCSRCVHGESCAVWNAHMIHNYDECNNDNSVLHMLIPRTEDGLGNKECKMFYEADAS
jgi:hypothetical protein